MNKSKCVKSLLCMKLMITLNLLYKSTGRSFIKTFNVDIHNLGIKMKVKSQRLFLLRIIAGRIRSTNR